MTNVIFHTYVLCLWTGTVTGTLDIKTSDAL